MKVDADVLAILNIFADATVNLKTLGPVALSSADKNTVAKNVANSINKSATALSKAPQTAAVVAASVKLDAQIKVFLDVLGLVVVDINPIIAKL